MNDDNCPYCGNAHLDGRCEACGERYCDECLALSEVEIYPATRTMRAVTAKRWLCPNCDGRAANDVTPTEGSLP